MEISFATLLVATNAEWRNAYHFITQKLIINFTIMKRFFFLFSLLLCTAAMSLAQFQQSKLPLADPFVFYEDGTYYAYGTYSSNGIVVFTSSNLIEWEEQP